MEPTNPKLYNPRVDQLRAVGFLLVVAVHFFDPRFRPLIDATPIVDIFGPVVSNGQFGVSLFFFLSGYILSRLASAQGGTIDYKKFFLARVLRLYPVWILCIVLVACTNNLTTFDILALLALFWKHLPPGTSFGALPWTIQMEMFLYLLFPILILHLTSFRRLAALLAFLFVLRVTMVGGPPTMLRDVAYASVLGALPLFASGVLLGRMPRLRIDARKRMILLIVPILIFYAIVSYIDANGGFTFQADYYASAFPGKVNRLAHEALWTLLPEAMVLCFAPLVVLYDAERINPSRPVWISQAGGALFALIGKVSYSGYMFHLLVLGFIDRVPKYFGIEQVNPFLFFAIYLCVLIPASWASFKVVEEPFLKLRKSYYSGARRDGITPATSTTSKVDHIAA